MWKNCELAATTYCLGVVDKSVDAETRDLT